MLVMQRPTIEAIDEEVDQSPALRDRSARARFRPHPRQLPSSHPVVFDPRRSGDDRAIRRLAARVRHHPRRRRGRHRRDPQLERCRRHLGLRRSGDRAARRTRTGRHAAPATSRRPADIEILNRDLHLATVNAKGRLAVDLTVEQGCGYLSSNREDDNRTIGLIPIDAIFSPVRRVAFDVEPTRVEQSTNYDRLVIEVETDGSLSARPTRSPRPAQRCVRSSTSWPRCPRNPRAWSSARSSTPP